MYPAWFGASPVQLPPAANVNPSSVSYVKWWHSLIIGFSLASWGLAQPLYAFVTENDLLRDATGPDTLIFILIYQGLPLAGLYLGDRLVIARRGQAKHLRYYRGLLFALAFVSLVRAIHLKWPLVGIDAVPVPGQVILSLAVLVLFAGFCIRFWRPVSLLFIYLSVVSAILTGLFVAEVGLAGKLWTDDPLEPSPVQAESESNRNPVFLLVFDGLGGDVLLKDGELDQELFPNFATLGRDGAVFTNATSNYLNSEDSFGSFMTGTFFSDDGRFQRGPSGAGSAGILGTVMDSGYSVKFYSSVFRCEDRGFHACRDKVSIAGKNVHIAARDFVAWFLPKSMTRTVRNLIVSVSPGDASLGILFNPIHQHDRSMWSEFVASVGESNSPGKVYFVHSLLPHKPYEFDRYGNRGGTVPSEVGFDDFEQMSAAYQQQVMFVDTLLGEFISRLKSEGLYDRSLVIVTGDHGPRSLGLGKAYSGFDTSREFPEKLSGIIPKVSLIIYGPQIAAQVSGVDYQHIDLMPTVLDVLDLPARPWLPGVSAFAPERPVREKVFYGIPNKGQRGEKVLYHRDVESSQWKGVRVGKDQ